MGRVTAILAVAVAVAASGCGKGGAGPVALHSVHGQVIYDEKPAAKVRVYLLTTNPPTDGSPPTPHAVTSADGSFVISTYAEGDGAPEGKYQVVLIWKDGEPGEEGSGDVDKLLGWYDPTRTTLMAEIKAGSNTLPPFKLKAITRPPGEIIGIPGKN